MVQELVHVYVCTCVMCARAVCTLRCTRQAWPQSQDQSGNEGSLSERESLGGACPEPEQPPRSSGPSWTDTVWPHRASPLGRGISPPAPTGSFFVLTKETPP